ncbi:hypothetical protein ACAG24_009360 [Mycobacterium sp. pW049]|uniref:hypothetical protein n=1 Tax=[Mycobacterium] bulgaricum TaxID=3238985 RepID=UPI00351BEAEE
MAVTGLSRLWRPADPPHRGRLFRPGARLPEEPIAESFGISLREALCPLLVEV